MYYSPTKKFMLLHSRKVAGSSIKMRLAPEQADDDIMIGGWSEASSRGITDNKQALFAAKSQKLNHARASIRDFLRGKDFHPTPIEMNRFIKHYYQSKFGLDGAAHACAASNKKTNKQTNQQTNKPTNQQTLGDRWDQAFKLAFVRNPWDHAISDYYWRNGPQNGVSFKVFLHLLRHSTAADPCKVRPPIVTNWSVYPVDDQVAVDFVGRFERRDSDRAKVSSKIGIDLAAHLPHAKPRPKDKTKPLIAHYDAETVELVRDIYRKEIEAFQYQVPF